MFKLKYFIFLAFVVGDCVKLTERLWWDAGEPWKIIRIEKDRYVISDGGWTVSNIPERLLRKCKEK